MTEKKTKTDVTEPKAAASKKPAAASRSDAKASTQIPAVKQPALKGAKSGGTVTLEQTGSPIGRQGYQRATLIGLGLNKLHRQRTLEDTPSVRGMIEKVKHLVKEIK